MMKGCIVLVIGLPASGKSTFISTLVDYINSNHVDMKPFYIDFDKVIPLEIQKLIATNRLETSWKESRIDFVHSCQAFLQLLLNPSSNYLASCSGSSSSAADIKYLEVMILQNSIENFDRYDSFCFIVEDNFYYKSMREPFFRLSKQFQLGLTLITINATIDSCLERDGKRLNCVGEKVIKRMADCLEKPRRDEFGVHVADRIQLVEIFTDRDDLKDHNNHYDEVAKLIQTACETPIETGLDDNENKKKSRDRGESRKATAVNLVHRFDKLLRSSVKRMLMLRPPVGNMGEEISSVRKGLLKRFSSNQLDFGSGETMIMEGGDDFNEKTIERVMNLIESELEVRQKEKGR